MNSLNLEFVVCPICRGNIKSEGEMIECLKCGQIYPILENVPNFLPQDLMEHYNKNLKQQDLFEEHSFYQNLYQNLNGVDDGHCVVYGYEDLYDFMEDIPKGALLDIGCGAGHHSKNLSQKGYNVTGIDISVNGIRQAKNVSSAANQNISFFLGDIENLPFDNNSFDVVFCGLIIHHFHKRNRLLSEIQRVTKNYFVAFEVNSYDPISFVRFNLINPTIGIKNITKNQRTVSPVKLKNKLESLGFGNTQIQYVDVHHNIGRYPKSLPSKLLKAYGRLMRLMPEKFRNNKFMIKCSKSS